MFLGIEAIFAPKKANIHWKNVNMLLQIRNTEKWEVKVRLEVAEKFTRFGRRGLSPGGWDQCVWRENLLSLVDGLGHGEKRAVGEDCEHHQVVKVLVHW